MESASPILLRESRVIPLTLLSQVLLLTSQMSPLTLTLTPTLTLTLTLTLPLTLIIKTQDDRRESKGGA